MYFSNSTCMLQNFEEIPSQTITLGCKIDKQQNFNFGRRAICFLFTLEKKNPLEKKKKKKGVRVLKVANSSEVIRFCVRQKSHPPNRAIHFSNIETFLYVYCWFYQRAEGWYYELDGFCKQHRSCNSVPGLSYTFLSCSNILLLALCYLYICQVLCLNWFLN